MIWCFSVVLNLFVICFREIFDYTADSQRGVRCTAVSRHERTNLKATRVFCGIYGQKMADVARAMEYKLSMLQIGRIIDLF